MSKAWCAIFHLPSKINDNVLFVLVSSSQFSYDLGLIILSIIYIWPHKYILLWPGETTVKGSRGVVIYAAFISCADADVTTHNTYFRTVIKYTACGKNFPEWMGKRGGGQQANSFEVAFDSSLSSERIVLNEETNIYTHCFSN